MKRWFRLGLAGALAVSAVALGVSPAAAQAKDPIKIGLLLPFNSVYAQLAEGIDKGWKLAVAEFGGQINGHKIEIIQGETESKPNVSVQAANRLIRSDKIDVMAGVVSSGVGVALEALAAQQKKPLVVAFAIADDITGKLCNPYTARTSFSGYAYQSGAGAYWAKQGMKTAVTIGPDYAAGRSMLDGFKAGFEAAGGKVVLQEWTPFQKTNDWGPYLTKAKDTGAQMIYSFYGGSESIQIVKQHDAFGMKKTMPLMGDQWLYDEALWSAMGDAVVGARHVTVHVPTLPNKGSKDFVAAFKKMFNEEPNVNNAMGYENAKSVLLAAQKMGGDIKDGAKFIKTLAGLSYEAPRGTMHFNADNNAVLENLYLVEIARGADGKLERKLIDTLQGGKDLPGCKMAKS